MHDELEDDVDDGPEPHNLAVPPELTAAPTVETCGHSWRHHGELVRCSQYPEHDAEHVVWRHGQILTVRAKRGEAAGWRCSECDLPRKRWRQEQLPFKRGAVVGRQRRRQTCSPRCAAVRKTRLQRERRSRGCRRLPANALECL